jgi:hypothetical protein
MNEAPALIAASAADFIAGLVKMASPISTMALVGGIVRTLPIIC